MERRRGMGWTIALVLLLLIGGALGAAMLFAHVVGRTTSEPPHG
jgi:type IV secretory pathway VirB2 component (pilin)